MRASPSASALRKLAQLESKEISDIMCGDQRNLGSSVIPK